MSCARARRCSHLQIAQLLSCFVSFDGPPLQFRRLDEVVGAGHLIRILPQLRGLPLMLPDLLRQPQHLGNVTN